MTRFLRLWIGAAAALAACAPAAAQFKPLTPAATVKLWPNGAPGSEARRGEPERAQDYWVRNVHDPSIEIYQPEAGRRTGTAIILVPGGGHEMLVWTANLAAARALNRMGVTAVALKYRLAREPGSKYRVEGEAMDDLRRSVRWVRAHASEYGIDPHRIGVAGFSAGGELASMLANYPPSPLATAKDDLARISARPDFQVQVFPGPGAVRGPVVADAPPAFLVAGSRDACCAAPTVQLYGLLARAGISAELHMYAEAGHAFNVDETDRISVLHWPDRLFDWLSDGGWLGPRGQ